MKKKLDFITNSSSASFIIFDSKIDTRKIAKQMAKVVFEEWKDFDGYVDKDFQKQIYDNIKKLDKNENIMIPFSCNYETFIYRIEDRIYIDTCNNHNWIDNIENLRWLDDETPEYVKLEEEVDQMIFSNIENEAKGSRKNLLDLRMKELMEGLKK